VCGVGDFENPVAALHVRLTPYSYGIYALQNREETDETDSFAVGVFRAEGSGGVQFFDYELARVFTLYRN